jgi:hypothetical protein
MTRKRTQTLGTKKMRKTNKETYRTIKKLKSLPSLFLCVKAELMMKSSLAARQRS